MIRQQKAFKKSPRHAWIGSNFLHLYQLHHLYYIILTEAPAQYNISMKRPIEPYLLTPSIFCAFISQKYAKRSFKTMLPI